MGGGSDIGGDDGVDSGNGTDGNGGGEGGGGDGGDGDIGVFVLALHFSLRRSGSILKSWLKLMSNYPKSQNSRSQYFDISYKWLES